MALVLRMKILVGIKDLMKAMSRNDQKVNHDKITNISFSGENACPNLF